MRPQRRGRRGARTTGGAGGRRGGRTGGRSGTRGGLASAVGITAVGCGGRARGGGGGVPRRRGRVGPADQAGGGGAGGRGGEAGVVGRRHGPAGPRGPPRSSPLIALPRCTRSALRRSPARLRTACRFARYAAARRRRRGVSTRSGRPARPRRRAECPTRPMPNLRWQWWRLAQTNVPTRGGKRGDSRIGVGGFGGRRGGHTPGVADRFDGCIAGLGSPAGLRVVVGHWPSSPLGPFTDVMVERPDGHRILLAPDERVAEFVAATYTFDEVRCTPVTTTVAGNRWRVTAGLLDLEFTTGRRTALGVLLRAVPRPLATAPAWITSSTSWRVACCRASGPAAAPAGDGASTTPPWTCNPSPGPGSPGRAPIRAALRRSTRRCGSGSARRRRRRRWCGS